MSSKEMAKRIEKRIKQTGSKVKIALFDEQNTEQDSIYAESLNKQYSNTYTLHALIIYHPDKQILSELGLDSETEVIAKVSFREVQNKGLTEIQDGYEKTIIDKKDTLLVEGKDYDITRVVPTTHYQEHHIYAIGGMLKEGS